MRARPPLVGLALLALLVPGCFGPGPGEPVLPTAPSPVLVEPPPPGGGFAPCHSRSAQQLALGFASETAQDDEGRGVGLHRVDERTFLWVWAVYQDTQRQDRVSRLNEVQVFQEPDGRLVVCTRVDLVAPLEVDGRVRSYDVAARFIARSRLPDAPLTVIVNWMAGCGACGGPRSGNATAAFPSP